MGAGRREPKSVPVGVLLFGAIGLGLAVGYLPSIAFALVLCAAIVLVGIMLFDPALAVLVYTASRPVADAFVFVVIGPFSAGQLWGAGLIAVCAFYVLLQMMRGHAEESYQYTLTPLVVLGTYALVTLSRPGVSEGVTNTLRMASWLLVAVVVERIASNAQGRERALLTGVVGGGLMLVTILIAATQNRYGPAYYAGEFTAIGQGPHGLSTYAVLSAAFPLFFMLERRGRIWPPVMVGLLFLAVVGSLVRTTLLAAIVLFIAYTLMVLRGKGARAILGAFVIIVVSAAIIFVAQDRILARFSDIGYISSGAGTEVWAGSGRIGIWVAVWNGVWDNPAALLTGEGATYSSALVYAAIGVERWAHNDFLEFLSTGGILLLGAYLWLIFTWARHGWRLRRSRDSHAQNFAQVYLGAVVAFVVIAFFNGIALYQASIVMGLLAGIAAGWVKDLNRSGEIADVDSSAVLA